MFDAHYDLLTELYISYLYQDFKRVDAFCKNFHKNNVKGLIANLCFMSESEMKAEYHKEYWDPSVSVLDMFTIATDLAKEKVSFEVSMYYGIEGCDKIEISDLEPLYKKGLRVIAPVWNEPNRYGSGIRGEYGLTEEGKAFVQKAIELGIVLDFSHANEPTFYDMLTEVKKAQIEGKQPVFFASHSNTQSLCNRSRNLTDDQIIALVKASGKIGIFSNRNFVYKNALQNQIPNSILKEQYIKHINKVLSLTGRVDAIVLSTDDMTWNTVYASDPDYAALSIFPYENIKEEVVQLLNQYGFDAPTIEKLLSKNMETALSGLEKTYSKSTHRK